MYQHCLNINARHIFDMVGSINIKNPCRVDHPLISIFVTYCVQKRKT